MKELCGCCEGLEKLTPLDTANRPGLDALLYRVGTHATFLETMMARLTTLPTTLYLNVAEETGDVKRILRDLTTRSFDDPSLALLDAWATVADVLTFYQERIANEGYLRTATERRSILELVRLVGYSLRPGVSASVFLAFDLEKGYNLMIEPGMRSQSLPGPGEMPQSFETAEPLEARAAWNRLGVRMSRPQYIYSNNIEFINKIYLKGTATNLKPNDLLLFRFEGDIPEPIFRKVESIGAKMVEDLTIVSLQPKKVTSESAEENAIKTEIVTATEKIDPSLLLIERLTRRPSLPPPSPRRLRRELKSAFAEKSDIGAQTLINIVQPLKMTFYPAWSSIKVPTDPKQVKSVEALRVKAAPFGHNAPKELTGYNKKVPQYTEWGLKEDNKILYLDAPYDKILPQSWVVIERPDSETTLICKVEEVRTVSRPEYGITGTVTRLTLDREWISDDEIKKRDLKLLRATTVYAQGEALPLAEEAIEPDKLVKDESGKDKRVNDIGEEEEIELDGLYDGLKSGRWLIISGERTDVAGARGVKASELVMLSNVTQKVGLINRERLPQPTEEKQLPKEIPLPGDKDHTFLTLATPLEYRYKRDTVSIYANVAKATHGETRREVLGSGDGGRAFQEFQLRQSPLTYLAAATPAGAESTLQVRVNDVLWHETDSLAGLEPVDRNYITSTDDQSKTSIIFGNGLHGSRLPSGMENVRAVYRTGIGKPGNVKAEQISQLAARPLGVKGVINPLPATGGADRESRDQARRNAPLAVLALDRLVSVQDYADFARTFAGIGKARATKLTNGRRQMVFLTIAGAEDILIDEHSDLYQNLVSALHKYGDPHQQIRVEMRELLLLVVSANVRVLPEYLWDKVEPKIRAAMLDAFSFERRDLGQDVLLSEVISVIQAVEGVDYVDVDVLVSIPEKEFESKIRADSTGQNGNEASGDRRRLTPEEILIWVQAKNAECNYKFKGPCPRIAVNLASWDKDGRLLPDQIAYLTPDVPDTLILKEAKP